MASYILPTARSFLATALRRILVDRRNRSDTALLFPSRRTRAKMVAVGSNYPPLPVTDAAVATNNDITGGGSDGR